MAKLHIMDRSGDTTLVWPDEITEAEVRERFDDLIEQGWFAYKVPTSGGTAEAIRVFDSTAEKIVMNPQFVGG